MRGHIRKRGSTYSIVVDIGRDENGKRKQKWYSGYKTKKEAEKALADIIAKVESGQVVDAKNLTVAEYLEQWLKDYAQHNVAPTTYASYVDAVKNITEVLGNIRLDKLKASQIQHFCSMLLETTNKSSTTVRYYYSVLNIALNTALKWQLLSANPCAGVTPPKKNKEQMKVLSEEQVTALLKGVEETPLYIPVLLAVTCGMRRGEILGLKWDNIDFEAKTIHIINNLTQADGKPILGEPKTDAGKRTIAAPDITIKALKEAKKKQAANKLALGTQYHDSGFVCCWDDGTPYRPDYITHAFPKLLEKLKLPVVRFHDLRHTHATLLLMQGVHPKVVQERMGHSDISVTLDTYSHVMPSMQKEVAHRIDDILSK